MRDVPVTPLLRQRVDLEDLDFDVRVSPYLVPWAQLSDEVRELDRRTVRGIPGFLARAGYQVVLDSIP